ncbi:MAG: hypothetical protein ACI8S6_002733 [Myxococcota bacterium]|jgi:hypothetical protein
MGPESGQVCQRETASENWTPGSPQSQLAPAIACRMLRAGTSAMTAPVTTD